MTSSTRHPYRSAHARFNPRLPGGRRPHTDVTRQTPPGTRQEPARSPHRARAGPLARMVARAPTSIPDRDSVTRRRFAPDAARNAPGAAQNAPGASQKPVPRARRPLARIVARAQTGVPARDSVTRRRFAPDAAQNAPGASQKPRTRQEPARSPERARSQPEARTARAPSAGACRGARTDRRTSPRRRYAPALRARRRPERARSQPQAPTARYFASARSPIRSGFDCDARALRNCNSTRPSCARRRRRSASVIGCGRPARSHRMHSSFVRVGFSFLLHVHAGRYGCSASGFHSLTSSRSRNRSSSVRE